MADQVAHFSLPRLPAFRYLLDHCRPVSERTASILLAELFASPTAVIPGVLNGLLLDIMALCLHAGRVFILFLILEAALAAGRVLVFRRKHGNANRGVRTPADFYLFISTAWCTLQGSMAFAAMQSGIAPLQLIAAMCVIGLVGPICARNYASPRFALLLIVLCDAPMLIGAVFSGNPWMLCLLLQVPGFLFGATRVTDGLQRLAIATLGAEEDSHSRAQRDALTGLLNRFGLAITLEKRDWIGEEGIFFYLDLDGFKPINDAYGHHTGDKILQAVARRLTAASRPGDLVCRLGGDEFIIVARHLSPQDGEEYAQRIISRVADEPYRLDDAHRHQIGVSVGFACCPEDGTAGDDLQRKADAALYEAKAAGKGVHRRFKSSPGQPMSISPATVSVC